MRWARRTPSAVLVILLHAGGVLLLLASRQSLPESQPEPSMVALETAAHARVVESVAELPVELQGHALPALVLPVTRFPSDPAPSVMEAMESPAAAVPSDAVTSGTSPRFVQQVDYLRPLQLTYPRPAKRRRAQGMVLVYVFIDSEGSPRVVSLHRTSGDSDLDKEALRAVRNARFRPPSVNGVPESVQVLVPVNFFLATP